METEAAALIAGHGPRWFSAAANRRSRRTYDGTSATPGALEELRAICDGFRPWPDARVELLEHAGEEIFTGIIGSYGRVSGAPHALLVIADTSSPYCQAHAGYTGEAAVLQATALRLGTCWIGGGFSAEAIRPHTNLLPAEQVLAIVAVGHPTERLSGTDRTMKLLTGSHKHKPVEQLLDDGGDGWPSWALAAVDAAQAAPSAVNRKPWRFRLDGDELVVSQDKRDSGAKLARALDCGIAMLHVELAARSEGAVGHWIDGGERPLDIARFRLETDRTG